MNSPGPCAVPGSGAASASRRDETPFRETCFSRSAFLLVASSPILGFRGSKNTQNVLFCSARASWEAKFAYLTVHALPRIHQAPARCTSETLVKRNLHTLQCARPLAGEICIPYSARAPWDSPCLGAVHSGGPSEANFAYLTVRAALGGRIFATFALHTEILIGPRNCTNFY